MPCIHRSPLFSLLLASAAVAAVVIACGGSDAGSPGTGTAAGVDGGARGSEPAGQTCTAPSQCYAGVTDAGADGGGISGTVTCLTKVTNGYCTHTCTQDSECCRAPGECLTGVAEVCSPLSNQPEQYCFLSCADADVQRAIAANGSAGYYDGGANDAGSVADAYCRSYAGTSTSCRSSGGGTKNRKVCLPN
jgi:hypothetical protein